MQKKRRLFILLQLCNQLPYVTVPPPPKTLTNIYSSVTTKYRNIFPILYWEIFCTFSAEFSFEFSCSVARDALNGNGVKLDDGDFITVCASSLIFCSHRARFEKGAGGGRGVVTCCRHFRNVKTLKQSFNLQIRTFFPTTELKKGSLQATDFSWSTNRISTDKCAFLYFMYFAVNLLGLVFRRNYDPQWAETRSSNSYNKTNDIQLIPQIYIEMELICMYRTVPLPLIRSLALYT